MVSDGHQRYTTLHELASNFLNRIVVTTNYEIVLKTLK